MSNIVVNGRTWIESELRELAGDLKAAVPPMAVNGGIAIGDLLDYIAAHPAPAALRAAFEKGAKWQREIDEGPGMAALAAIDAYPDSPASGPMTRDQFEQRYAELSKTTVWELHRMGRFAYPCNCDDADCKGWQMAHVQIQDENDAPAPYKAGCSSAVPFPEDGIIAYFENKYPRLEEAGLICGCGVIGCVTGLDRLVNELPAPVPAPTRAKVLAVLSDMQSVMCGAALNGREQTADAILALLTPPQQAGGDIKEELPVGQNVVSVRPISKNQGGVIPVATFGRVVGHAAHGPIEIKFTNDSVTHLFDSPDDWVAKVYYE